MMYLKYPVPSFEQRCEQDEQRAIMMADEK